MNPRSRRKTLAPPPNIVVTPAKINLKAKRHRTDSSDDSDDYPPQEGPSKRAKRGASKGEGKAADDGEGRVEKNPSSLSAIYPTPITAIFPPTPLTAVSLNFQQGIPFQTIENELDNLTTPTSTPPKPKKPFQMLTSFLRHPELILNLAKVLHPTSLINLYAISKPFHFILNSHYTTYIKANMEYHAPESNLIFPWRCYARLCIKDPGWRPMCPSKPGVARDVPSLRWLQMVTYRSEVIHDILMALCKYGLVLPKGIEKVIKKMWFLCDLPANANRIGVLHNTGYFLDRDIYYAQMFIMKLDMRFTDPVEGNGELHLRKLLFGCRNFVPMRDFLVGKISLTHLLQRVVWYQYNPSPSVRALQFPIIGIAPMQIGNGNTENWGRGQQRLLRVDEGIMREAVRRELNTHKYFLEFLLFGHLELAVRQGGKKDMVQLKDLAAPDIGMGRKARMEPFAFYRNAQSNVKVEEMMVPSEQGNLAVVEDGS